MDGWTDGCLLRHIMSELRQKRVDYIVIPSMAHEPSIRFVRGFVFVVFSLVRIFLFFLLIQFYSVLSFVRCL